MPSTCSPLSCCPQLIFINMVDEIKLYEVTTETLKFWCLLLVCVTTSVLFKHLFFLYLILDNTLEASLKQLMFPLALKSTYLN